MKQEEAEKLYHNIFDLLVNRGIAEPILLDLERLYHGMNIEIEAHKFASKVGWAGSKDLEQENKMLREALESLKQSYGMKHFSWVRETINNALSKQEGQE